METEVRGRASKLAAECLHATFTNFAVVGSSKRGAEVELDYKGSKRQRLIKLQVRVEEVYVKALQVKYPIIDWEVELKRLFEPDTDDALWKLQRERIGYFYAGRERISIVKRDSDFDVG
nr:hypothetical protein [Tanacetum cinerariifolium]